MGRETCGGPRRGLLGGGSAVERCSDKTTCVPMSGNNQATPMTELHVTAGGKSRQNSRSHSAAATLTQSLLYIEIRQPTAWDQQVPKTARLPTHLLGKRVNNKRQRLFPLWQQQPDAHFYHHFVNTQLGSVAIFRRHLTSLDMRGADLFSL